MQELLERKKGLRRSILIVDDDYIAREILGKMLKDQYEVSYAENGVIGFRGTSRADGRGILASEAIKVLKTKA